MMLSSKQYDEIIRIYDERKARAKELGDQRLDEMHKKYPDIAAIDKEIVEASFELGMKAIQGEKDAIERLKAENAERIARKSELTKKYGIPSTYFTDIYYCNKCKDTGRTDGGYCECFYRTVIDRFFLDEDRKRVLSEQNFSNFNAELYDKNVINTDTGKTDFDTMKDTALAAMDFADFFTERNKTGEFKNLLITGKVGSGKTYLANCIADQLIKNNVSVLYIPAMEFFKKMGDSLFSGKNDGGTDIIYTADCLIVDDLGTEYHTSQVGNILYELLENRLGKRMSTIFTTNLSYGRIEEIYSERVLSRIRKYFAQLLVPGGDKRLVTGC